jgi:23S rRNA (pseudouridine1915-N3)-methyltransferase
LRLILAAVGRLKAGPERELFARYHARAQAIARAAGISGVDSIEFEEARGRSAEERKRAEASLLMANVPQGAYVMALDERGSTMTSRRFAALVGKTRDMGLPALVLLIGGPDGLDENVRKAASASFAFGAATLPHQLVRVLAAEQIYRAFTILTGHPYHRA